MALWVDEGNLVVQSIKLRMARYLGALSDKMSDLGAMKKRGMDILSVEPSPLLFVGPSLTETATTCQSKLFTKQVIYKLIHKKLL